MIGNRTRFSMIVGSAAMLLVLTAGGAWYLLDPGFRTGDSATADAGVARNEFERRVRDYILTNPEVIVAALRGLEARNREAAIGEVKSVLQARADEIFHDLASPVGGNPRGDVTLVEFFDYNCPYRRRMVPAMAEAEAADPELRIVYKEFPILGAGSTYAAKAALAADQQGRYPAFHQALMAVKGSVEEDSVLEAATAVGLNLARLKANMDDPAVQAVIARARTRPEATERTEGGG